MEEDNNLFRISVGVGNFQVTEKCPELHCCVDLSKQITTKKTQKLIDLGLPKEFCEFSIVQLFKVEEGREEDVKKALDGMLNSKDYDGNLLKPFRQA